MIDKYVDINIIVSNQYNQQFFNVPDVIDINNIKIDAKIKVYPPFNTKIIENKANNAAIIVDIAWTLYSNILFLKSGAIDINNIAIGQRNAKNCQLDPSNISNQPGTNNPTQITIVIGNKHFNFPNL